MPDSPEHTQCEHPFDLHVMVSPSEEPLCGFGVCPVVGCKCYFTWGVRGTTRSTLEDLGLTEETINEVRTRIQTGEM